MSRALARRVGRLANRAERQGFASVQTIVCHRPGMDPSAEDAALRTLEGAIRPELAALGTPGAVPTIWFDRDGTGVVEAAGWRWRLALSSNGKGATVLRREALSWRS